MSLVLTDLLAENNDTLVLSLEPMNTFLSAAVDPVFSYSRSFLLITFLLISVSRRLVSAGPV